MKKMQALFYSLLKWRISSKHLKDGLHILTYVFKHSDASSSIKQIPEKGDFNVIIKNNKKHLLSTY